MGPHAELICVHTGLKVRGATLANDLMSSRLVVIVAAGKQEFEDPPSSFRSAV